MSFYHTKVISCQEQGLGPGDTDCIRPDSREAIIVKNPANNLIKFKSPLLCNVSAAWAEHHTAAINEVPDFRAICNRLLPNPGDGAYYFSGYSPGNENAEPVAGSLKFRYIPSD